MGHPPAPGGDVEFNAWLDNFVTYAGANLANLGLVQAARSTTQQKNADRAAAVSLVRALVGRLQASPEVDDTGRAALTITVPDSEPTPTGPPTTWPAGATPEAKRGHLPLTGRRDEAWRHVKGGARR